MSYYYYYYDIEDAIRAALGFASDFQLVTFIIAALKIITAYLVVEKAGEKGWKALIPVYNRYLDYKLYWHPFFFWFDLIVPLVSFILFIFGFFSGSSAIAVIFVVMATILMLSRFILGFVLQIKKGKCFGEGTLFGIGLIFLNTIFNSVIAFDKKITYIGNNANINLDEIKISEDENEEETSEEENENNE